MLIIIVPSNFRTVRAYYYVEDKEPYNIVLLERSTFTSYSVHVYISHYVFKVVVVVVVVVVVLS